MSSTDEDILNATENSLKIFQDSAFRKNKRRISSLCKNENLENKFVSSESSQSQVIASSSVESSESVFLHSHSEYSKNDTTSSHSDVLQFQKTSEESEAVILMHEFFLEKLKDFEDKDAVSFITDIFNEIISPSNINKSVENLKSITSHMKTIAAEEPKLKQVLRSNVTNDQWKINRLLHKSVRQFFIMSQDLMEGLQYFIELLERIPTHKTGYKQEKFRTFIEKEMKLKEKMHDYVDALAEFRVFLKQHCEHR